MHLLNHKTTKKIKLTNLKDLQLSKMQTLFVPSTLVYFQIDLQMRSNF